MEPEAEKNPQSTARKIGSLTSTLLQNATPSELTPNVNGKNSAITTMQGEQNFPIGMPLSETGLQTLRNFGRGMLQGRLISDKELQALFVQECKSPPVIEKKLNHEYEVTGYRIEFFEKPDQAMIEAVEFFNAPTAKGELVAAEISRLLSITVRPKEEQLDLVMKIGALTEELSDYPFDVIKTVCRDWPRLSKWQPSLFELRQRCEVLVCFRRALLAAMKNPVKRLAKRDDTDYRNTPKARWEKRHFEAFIADMRGSADVCEKNGISGKEGYLARAAELETEMDNLFPKSTLPPIN